MADTFKQMIPTGNRDKTEKQYSFDHLTTVGFMEPTPIAIREVVPNMELKMAVESFCRLNPLVKPTFGRCRVNNRAFFVPMRILMKRWNEFLSSEPYFSVVDSNFGLATSVPVVSNSTLIQHLLTCSSAGTSSDFDWSYLDSSNVVQYEKLNAEGHYSYRLLISLGYKINFMITDNTNYSALPLMAFAKIMMDWYYPSQYINSSAIQYIAPYYDNDSLNAVSLPAAVVRNMISVCRFAAYNDSLYVDAWDRPVAPNSGVESQYSIPDITFPSGIPVGAGTYDPNRVNVNNNTANGTPFSDGQQPGANGYHYPNTITQYQHDVLKALTDYTTRHRLSGVRAVDRLLSEYGINLSSEIMKRSVMLGSDTFNIQFGDVMAHSDTYNSGQGAVLGDYAGKGIGYGNNVFNYQLGNEFGYLIVVNSVIPEAGYYQGVNRLNYHKSILDFYHPDFDGLGVQAVGADEVYLPEVYNANFTGSTIRSKVFGFVPRYAEYKTAPSIMSGLFSLYGNADIKKFSLMRDLSYLFSSYSDIEHDINFVQGRDSSQYNRVFYNDSEKDYVQNFIFIHHIEISQLDETAPLYETYDFKRVKRMIEEHSQAAKVN